MFIVIVSCRLLIFFLGFSTFSNNKEILFFKEILRSYNEFDCMIHVTLFFIHYYNLLQIRYHKKNFYIVHHININF